MYVTNVTNADIIHYYFYFFMQNFDNFLRIGFSETFLCGLATLEAVHVWPHTALLPWAQRYKNS